MLVRRRAADALRARAARTRGGKRQRAVLEPGGIRRAARRRCRRSGSGARLRGGARTRRGAGTCGTSNRHAFRDGGAVQHRLQCSIAAHAARQLQLSRPYRQHPTAELASGRRRGGARDSTAGRRLRRTSGSDRRRVPPPRSHRCKSRLCTLFLPATGVGQCVALIELGGGFRPGGPGHVFQGTGRGLAHGDGRVGRSRAEHAHGRCERPGRRGDARHRGGRRDRAAGHDRGVLRAQHRCRISRCNHHCDSRHDQQAVGDFHQLGRGGVDAGPRRP